MFRHMMPQGLVRFKYFTEVTTGIPYIVLFHVFINSESLDFPCSCAAQLAELTEYFFTKICAVMGEGGHLQQRG